MYEQMKNTGVGLLHQYSLITAITVQWDSRQRISSCFKSILLYPIDQKQVISHEVKD